MTSAGNRKPGERDWRPQPCPTRITAGRPWALSRRWQRAKRERVRNVLHEDMPPGHHDVTPADHHVAHVSRARREDHGFEHRQVRLSRRQADPPPGETRVAARRPRPAAQTSRRPAWASRIDRDQVGQRPWRDLARRRASRGWRARPTSSRCRAPRRRTCRARGWPAARTSRSAGLLEQVDHRLAVAADGQPAARRRQGRRTARSRRPGRPRWSGRRMRTSRCRRAA